VLLEDLVNGKISVKSNAIKLDDYSTKVYQVRPNRTGQSCMIDYKCNKREKKYIVLCGYNQKMQYKNFLSLPLFYAYSNKLKTGMSVNVVRLSNRITYL
jgi:hypothetical protein